MNPYNQNVPIKKLIGIAAANFENNQKVEEKKEIENASDKRRRDNRPGEAASHNSIPEEPRKEQEIKKEQENRPKKERAQSGILKNMIEAYFFCLIFQLNKKLLSYMSTMLILVNLFQMHKLR